MHATIFFLILKPIKLGIQNGINPNSRINICKVLTHKDVSKGTEAPKMTIY